jgi:large subunit ribosomal protein L23
MRLRPVISEKSFAGAEKGVYTFRVTRDANKPEVKRAIQSAFKVTVVDVRIANTAAKTRQRGVRAPTGTRPGYKKAIVKLKEGDTIAELEG